MVSPGLLVAAGTVAAGAVAAVVAVAVAFAMTTAVAGFLAAERRTLGARVERAWAGE